MNEVIEEKGVELSKEDMERHVVDALAKQEEIEAIERDMVRKAKKAEEEDHEAEVNREPREPVYDEVEEVFGGEDGGHDEREAEDVQQLLDERDRLLEENEALKQETREFQMANADLNVQLQDVEEFRKQKIDVEAMRYKVGELKKNLAGVEKRYQEQYETKEREILATDGRRAAEAAKALEEAKKLSEEAAKMLAEAKKRTEVVDRAVKYIGVAREKMQPKDILDAVEVMLKMASK